jgi:SAM-dependent methyltransferase
METPLQRGSENRAYEAFHAPRFAFLLRILKERSTGTPERVLDIGLSPLTASLARSLGGPVDSLGLESDAELAHGRQYHFDLNDSQDERQWRTDLGPYDVIVFAEVVEHLYTAPEKVLSYLHSLLAPGGALILQTPNAAALRKRLKLLLGRNPYERIRPDRSNPGHFREYTIEELRSILGQTGFSVRNTWMKYYFDSRFARHETGHESPALVVGAAKNLLYRWLPGRLQEGITILARRDF